MVRAKTACGFTIGLAEKRKAQKARPYGWVSLWWFMLAMSAWRSAASSSVTGDSSSMSSSSNICGNMSATVLPFGSRMA